MNIGSMHVLINSVLLNLLTQGFKVLFKVSRFYSRFQGSIKVSRFQGSIKVSRFYSRFQGFIELFAPGGLENEVTFAHDIPYEQVYEFY